MTFAYRDGSTKIRELFVIHSRVLTFLKRRLGSGYINSLINPLPNTLGAVARLKANNGIFTLFIYNKAAEFLRPRIHSISLVWILWFMWFRKKEIYLQIKEYEKNQEFLIELAQHTGIKRIQDINRDLLKRFYKERIEPQASMYYKIEEVKYVNKFMRAYGVPFVLRTEEVVEITPNDDIVDSMRKVSKFNPTPKVKRNKRIVYLIDEKHRSLSEVCADPQVNLRAKSTVHEIYWREKKRSGLSTGK